MDKKIEILKGINPGKFIEYELNKTNRTQRELAVSAGVPYQTINNIIAGTRRISVPNALKLEKALSLDEGFLSILQTYFEIEKQKAKDNNISKPNIRKMLFWDTDFDKINWEKQKNAVIMRVRERGNKAEKEEISRFYGFEKEEIENDYNT
ncbi:MAG: helix-turn-helix domain-containing protein [Porphyromonadaceae bacterium]|nr:helix-turn-helix domain-containing protein [Porphyromonadaceae bacterium]